MRIEIMNGLSRTPSAMLNACDYTYDEMMQGLSRIEFMGDDEFDQTLGKLFSGKGRARRQARREKRRSTRRAARSERIVLRGEGRASTAAAGGGIRGMIRQVGGAIGQALGRGEELPAGFDDQVMRLDSELGELPWKDKETLGLKNPVALAVYGGGGLLVVGTGIWLLTRKKKRR